MAERKRRTDEHRRADVAVKVVQLAIARAGHVSIVGEQGTDYGTDLSVETFDDGGYRENGRFVIQVKSVVRPTLLADGRTLTLLVDRRDLAHWLDEPEPVILVLYDATADLAHWVHVQRYFARRPTFSLRAAGERVTIHVDSSDVFDVGGIGTIVQTKRRLQQQLGRSHHG